MMGDLTYFLKVILYQAEAGIGVFGSMGAWPF
jgi:hypothetical protein